MKPSRRLWIVVLLAAVAGCEAPDPSTLAGSVGGASTVVAATALRLEPGEVLHGDLGLYAGHGRVTLAGGPELAIAISRIDDGYRIRLLVLDQLDASGAPRELTRLHGRDGRFALVADGAGAVLVRDEADAIDAFRFRWDPTRRQVIADGEHRGEPGDPTPAWVPGPPPHS